jgi:hypothetical protein
MKSLLWSIAIIASALTMTTPALAQKNTDKPNDKRYEFVQVNRFNVEPGVDFPPDYQLTIDEDLNKALGKIKGLKQVLREGEPLPASEPVMVVTGTITKFRKGNQAARYLVGFGAGSTVIGAHIKCFDAATKELLLERDVDGKVVMGVMGGKSEGANNGLAKEVAKDIKERLR